MLQDTSIGWTQLHGREAKDNYTTGDIVLQLRASH